MGIRHHCELILKNSFEERKICYKRGIYLNYFSWFLSCPSSKCDVEEKISMDVFPYIRLRSLVRLECNIENKNAVECDIYGELGK